MFGDVLSNGNGGFIVQPRKPVMEVGPAQAAKILGVAHSSISNLLDRPMGQKLIKWRWSSEACGKRLFDASSLAAYREAMRLVERPSKK